MGSARTPKRFSPPPSRPPCPLRPFPPSRRGASTSPDVRSAARRDIKELDTKIEQIRADLKRDIEEFRADLKRDIKELETRVFREMKDLEYRMTIKLGTVMVVRIGAMATLAKLL